MILRRSAILCAAVFALLLGGSARAQADTYEEHLIDQALAHEGLTRDRAPDGKPIEEIREVRFDVVTPEDPWPSLFNVFHVTTRPWVIRREVLLSPGQPYDPRRAHESARNLRNFGIFAVARIVAAKGQHGGVIVLVVTKDLWSLRLNSEYRVIGTLLQLLHLQPSENNFFGTGIRGALDFRLALDTLSLGESFRARRLFGSGLQLAQNTALIFNRGTGTLEGSYGGVSFGQPLYSLEDTLAYGIDAGWNVQRTRIFRGATVWRLPFVDDPSITVPYVYDTRELDLDVKATRSFGSLHKLNVTAALGGYQHHYSVPISPDIPDAARTWFAQTQLPRSEDAVYLSAAVQAFEARYAVLRDYDSFALSEDFRLGYDLLLQLRWADPVFFSPTRYLALGVAAHYRWLWGEDLFTVEAAGATRWMPDASGPGIHPPLVNRRVAFEVENESPEVWIGRFVVRGLLDVTADDLDHVKLFIGGTEGLRGTQAEAFSGTKAVLLNLEYRTRPWVFHSFHTGLVLFYDAGSAFDTSPSLVHTVGVGLRILVPQFNLYPIRIDFGVALNGPSVGFADHFTSTFGQITSFRPAFLDSPL